MNRTTKAKAERNQKVKAEMLKELEAGLSLKEALYVVAERWYISPGLVKQIYYETRLEE